MEFCNITILILLIWTHANHIETAKIVNEGEVVYLTNTCTQYHNIPSYCKLFGSDLCGQVSDKITVNYTTEETFWINARIGFKRNLNPLGVKNRCTQNRPNGIALDKCSEECKTKYIYHGKSSCICSANNYTDDDGFGAARACEDEEYGLCFSGKCILYENDIPERNLLCEAYQHYTEPIKIWIYSLEDCNTAYNYICEKEAIKNNRTTTWFLAHHYCEEQKSRLIKTDGKRLENYKDGKKYWIAPFRRLVFNWGTGKDDSICVAARVNESGVLEPFSTFCNNSFQSLCVKQGINKEDLETSPHSSVSVKLIIGVVFGCSAGCIFVVLMILKKKKSFCNTTFDLQSVEHNEESNTLNENQANMKNTVGSLHDLAVYSDPNHCLPKLQNGRGFQGMDNLELLYKSTDNTHALPNMTNARPEENPYQSPFA